MIKAIVLDCDGVCTNTRQIHFESLNQALEEVSKRFVISLDDHLENFNGKPTKIKLKLLNERGLSPELNEDIFRKKQHYTEFYIRKLLNPDDYKEQRDGLLKLKEEGYRLACCSNAIRSSLLLMLQYSVGPDLFEYILSNEDVKHSKPSPAIYLSSMIYLDVGPRECLILEDSEVGLKSAMDSGAFVMRIEDPSYVKYDSIKMYLDFINRNG